jgi:hypothetical protein
MPSTTKRSIDQARAFSPEGAGGRAARSTATLRLGCRSETFVGRELTAGLSPSEHSQS